MTGAQEQALIRLDRRREHFKVLSRRPNLEGEVSVQWSRRNPWGGFTTIKAAITPAGQVVEVPR